MLLCATSGSTALLTRSVEVLRGIGWGYKGMGMPSRRCSTLSSNASLAARTSFSLMMTLGISRNPVWQHPPPQRAGSAVLQSSSSLTNSMLWRWTTNLTQRVLGTQHIYPLGWSRLDAADMNALPGGGEGLVLNLSIESVVVAATLLHSKLSPSPSPARGGTPCTIKILICVTAVGHLNIQASLNIHVRLRLLRIGTCCFEFYGRVHTVYTF